MKKIALPVALFAVLAATTPAFADGGLPKIASLQVGSHTVSIHGDSPSLHTGTNTFTVEIPALSSAHSVSLRLTGPSGQTVSVPLKDLVVVSGPEDHSSMADMPGMAGMDHGTAGGDGAHSHDEGSFDARGKAVINTPGTWTIAVDITGHGGTQSAQTSVDVVRGGPSRLYLGFTGLLIGGSITYGVAQRRRQNNGR